MTRSSGRAKATIKGSKQDMECMRKAENEGGDVRARIMVVDNEEIVCNLLETSLIGAGHQVIGCLSGQEAIAKLKEGSFDLAITGLNMPGVDGFDVLRKAKELAPLCEVIVITSQPSIESAVKAIKLGAYDYISKPVNADKIRVLVDRVLEKRRLVQVDGLTELYNCRGFHELLEAEISRSERHPRCLSVLIMGLDGPKILTDAFGHAAADLVLRQELARLLKKSVRKGDVVARYRQDEFAIILVESNKMGAISAANRLGHLVEKTGFEHDDVSSHRTLTMSIGVATYPTDAGDKVQLVTKADQALREAKMQGGNLVRTASQEVALTRVDHCGWLYFLCKRCLDIMLSLLFLVITLPVFLVIALLIKMDSPGPVFFKQERVGLQKRSVGGEKRRELSTFAMYKFRTMRHNCNPGIHQQLVKALIRGDEKEVARLRNNSGSVDSKLSNDGRVTRVGNVLRKTALDELPQLWNVLKGEMSLVGPRPPTVYEVAEYGPRHRRRLETIPGCTGLWQVSQTCALDYDEMVDLDTWYIEHQSLWLDMRILLRTLQIVLFAKGSG